jgi:5-methylcytosine-specific restriction protein B
MKPAAPFPDNLAVLGDAGAVGLGQRWPRIQPVPVDGDRVRRGGVRRLRGQATQRARGTVERRSGLRVVAGQRPRGQGAAALPHALPCAVPDAFERIFSQGNKYQVARAHKIWTPALGESRPAMDSVLLDLRKRLEVQHPVRWTTTSCQSARSSSNRASTRAKSRTRLPVAIARRPVLPRCRARARPGVRR